MILKELFAILGSGEWLRIGTEHGIQWLFYGRTIQLYNTIPAEYLKRKVMSMYTVEERKDGDAIDLEAGIAILVHGYELGTI